MQTENTLKTCTKCNTEKNLTDFHRFKDGHNAHCKSCRKAKAVNEHKRNNPRRNSILKKRYGIKEDFGVYCIKDDKNTVVYIGESKEIAKRYHYHFNNVNGKFKSFKQDCFTLEVICQCKNDLVRKETEAKLIKLFQPIYNLKGR